MSAILGVLFAIVLSTYGISQFIDIQNISNQHIQEAVTAQQHIKINEAATAYVQTYAIQVKEQATATVPAVITVDMLKNADGHFLPASFIAENPYGQTWQVQVLQPEPDYLQVLTLSTGGTELNDKTVARISALIGQAGGFIPQNDSGLYATGNAYGAFGGWKKSLAGYQNITVGRPVSLLTFNAGQLTSNYLYRNYIPDQPQLNQMNTSIDMKGNDLNHVGEVKSAKLSVTDNAKVDGDLGVGGNVSFGMAKINAVVIPGSSCEENGLLASTHTGGLISCQSGVWRAAQSRFKSAWTPIPASGNVSLLTYIPTEDQHYVSTIQVSVLLKTNATNDFGTDCYGLVDGKLFHRTGFDTSSNKEWMATTGTIMLSPESHTFSWECKYGQIVDVSLTISGYL